MSVRVGFMGDSGKFLTCEKFGNKLNVNGTALRGRQVWTLTVDARGEEPTVCIMSASGNLLKAGKKGELSCNEKEPCPETQWAVVYGPDGRWALRTTITDLYLCGQEDMLESGGRQPQWWSVQLAIHPLVNLKNVSRDRFTHLSYNSESNDPESFLCTALIPWGEQAILLMDFLDGKYALRTCGGLYLNREGQLTEALADDSLFSVELRTAGTVSGIAFRDNQGVHLAQAGVGMLKRSNRKVVTKDELFLISESKVQASIINIGNGKRCSVKQGMDVSANQFIENDDEEEPNYTHTEIFQIELDKSGRWELRTVSNKLWALQKNNGITACELASTPATSFTIEWLEGGYFGIRASNKNFLKANPTGSLLATSDKIGPKETFRLEIVNRPLVVFKGMYGFIGPKTASSARLECNKSTHDTFRLLQNGDGLAAFQASSGQYWSVSEDGAVTASSADPVWFSVELRAASRVALRAPNLMYLSGEQNGNLSAKETDPTKESALWEF